MTPIGRTRDGFNGGQGQNDYELLMRRLANQATTVWSTNSEVANVLYPNAWIRLKRQGDTFSAFRSDDGIRWTQLGQTNQTYPAKVYLGLATTSHNNSPGFSALARYRGFGLAGSPPVSSGFGAATLQDQPLLISVSALMGPISDPTGGLVKFISASVTSTNGAPVLSTSTSITYTPNASFVGADRFGYVVSGPSGIQTTVFAQIAVMPVGTRVNAAKSVEVTSASVSFVFGGLPGRTYQVQRAEQLTGPWAPRAKSNCYPRTGIVAPKLVLPVASVTWLVVTVLLRVS